MPNPLNFLFGSRPPAVKDVYPNMPPGLRSYLLLTFSIDAVQKYGLDKAKPFSDEADRINRLHLERNQQGGELEKVGNIDDAIKCYEQNVQDQFHGQYPYERLRVIYAKRGQIDDAIRVCKAYINMDDAFAKISARPQNYPNSKRDKFIEWIEKLEKKKVSQ